MRIMLKISIILLISSSLYSQSKLNGVVTYYNSGGILAKGIKVSALGCNSVYTNDGQFQLEFESKVSGDNVNLILGNTDENGASIEIINLKEIEALRIPSDPENEIIRIYICKAGQRQELARQYYNILSNNLEKEYLKRIDLLISEVSHNTSEKKVENHLLSQIEILKKKQSDALTELEKTAIFIASINKDIASDIVKNAIESLENDNNIDIALSILNSVQLERAYQNSLKDKNKIELEQKKIIEAYELKSNLLFTKFDYKEAIICLDRIIEIIIENNIKGYDLFVFKFKKGQLLSSNSDYNEALIIQLDVIELMKVAWGENSLDLAVAYVELGQTYKSLGNYKSALEYCLKGTRILEKDATAKVWALALSYNNLGILYKDNNLLKEALKYQKKSFSLTEKHFGSDSKEFAASYSNLASILGTSEDYKNAVVNQLKGIKILENLDKYDPFIAMSYSNLSTYYLELNEYNKAIGYLLKAEKILEEFLPPDHRDLAIVYNNIGMIYGKTKDFDNAIRYQEKSIAIFNKVLSENHHITNSVKNNLNHYLHDKARNDIEESNFLSALTGLQRIDNKQAIDWKLIGFCYYSVRFNANALKAIEKYLELNDDQMTKEDYQLVGLIFVVNLNFEKAHELFSKYDLESYDKKQSAFNWMHFYGYKNDDEKSLDFLELAIKFGFDNIDYLKDEPAFFRLQHTDRFQTIIKKTPPTGSKQEE